MHGKRDGQRDAGSWERAKTMKKKPGRRCRAQTTKRRMEERFQNTHDAALQQERARVLLRCVN
jgi:hypothetical protein